MSIYKPYCVYLITYRGNKLPPFYIGSTSIMKIEKGYMGSVKSKRYKAIWKSELHNSRHLFRIKTISFFESRSEAYEKERELQKMLNILKNPLYTNCSISGTSYRHGPVSAETRIKLSNAGKGRKHSTESRQKISNALLGRGFSKEHCENMSRVRLGKPRPNGVIKKMHQSNIGRKRSVEHRKCISIAISKRVIANFIEYSSVILASKCMGLDKNTIRARIIRGVPGYSYVTE